MRAIAAIYELFRSVVAIFGPQLPSTSQLETIAGRFFAYRQTEKFINLSEKNARDYYRPLTSDMVEVDFIRNNRHLPQLLIIDGKKVNSSDVHVRSEQSFFEPSAKVMEMTSKGYSSLRRHIENHADVRIYNSRNTRVRDVLVLDGKFEIVTQVADYNTYLRTNLCLDHQTSRKRSLRQELHPKGILGDVSQSELADLLGINILLFTQTNQLIVQQRSRRTIVRPGEWAPSVSGPMTPDDWEQGTTTLADANLFREGTEELGLFAEDLVHEPKLLGLTRELVRGGQPELFFWSKIKVTEDDLKERWKEAEDRFEAANVMFLPFDDHDAKIRKKAVKKIWTANHAVMSLPLKTAIALWYDHQT